MWDKKNPSGGWCVQPDREGPAGVSLLPAYLSCGQQ